MKERKMREINTHTNIIKRSQTRHKQILGIMSLAVVVVFTGGVFSEAEAKPKFGKSSAERAAKKSVDDSDKVPASSGSVSYWPSSKNSNSTTTSSSSNSSNKSDSENRATSSSGSNNLVSSLNSNSNNNSAQPRAAALGAGAVMASGAVTPEKYGACESILKTKNQTCTVGDCEQSQKMLGVSYQLCTASEDDTAKTRRPGSLEEKKFQTSTGFSYAFKNIEIGLTSPSTDYNKTKTEYSSIKAQYQPVKRKNNEYINQGKFMDQGTYQTLMGQEKKIEESITKLDLILANSSNYEQFKASYKKFVPDILLDKPEYDKKYRNQTFSKIECEFLNLTFRVDVINQLQKKYSYSCAA